MESLNKNFYLYEYVDIIKLAFEKGKTAKLDIIGSSMLPTLKEGDFVILDKPENIKQGDIILYNLTDTTFALHRVIKVSDILKVCGDNNVVTELVEKSAVIAKVKTIVKDNNKIESDSSKYKFQYYKMLIRLIYRKVKQKIKKCIK